MTNENKNESKTQEPAEPVAAKTAAENSGTAPAADATAKTPAGPPEAELQQEAADVSAEIEALKDRLLRLQADFDNFRKRTARDRAEMCVRANEDLIRELLPALDHFEIGLRSAAEHGAEESVRQGFQLVYDQLQAALAKFGVTPVDAVGVPFDAQEHEAITHAPSSDIPAGTVMQQLRRGYRLGTLLLRPAQVLVSSGPPEAAPES